MVSFDLTLPYPVSVNRYWRQQTVKKNGRVMQIPLPTTEGKLYKTAVAWRARAAGVRAPIKGPVQYEMWLYPNRPQDWAKRMRKDATWWDIDCRCLDLDNARKVLLDALNGIAWTDDSMIFDDSAHRMMPDGPARVRMRIWPFERPATGCNPITGQLELTAE